MTETRYALAYGRTIAIEFDNEEIALPYLPFEWTNDAPAVPIDRGYRVTTTAAGTVMRSIDGAAPIEYMSVASANDDIEGDLHHWLATYTRGYLFVHAGCVSWRNRAIVLPGRSHAGKTTLTKALVEAGATYYSDDYAVVDAEGMIWPFPRRPHIRPIDPAPFHRLDPVASNWPIGRIPIRAAIVAELRFDRQNIWNVEQLTDGLGALSLLDNTVAARERPEDALHMMANVIDGAIAIKGIRDDPESSARRLLAIVDDLLDTPAARLVAELDSNRL